jgi:hypothetical protein
MANFKKLSKQSVDKMKQHLLEVEKIAKEELGIDNVLYNERYMEILIADVLGHSYNLDTQGGDAYEADIQKETEYKSINLRNKSGGGSFQFHWLSDNKMEKYSSNENVYCVERDGVTIKEILKVPMSKILKELVSKSSGSKSISAHKSFSKKSLIKKYNAETIFNQTNSAGDTINTTTTV